MAKLTLDGQEYGVDIGVTLKRAFAQNGIPFTFPCGGRRACGKCRVKVSEGQVSPLCEDEERLLPDHLIREGVRLACCTVVKGDLKVELLTPERDI